MKEFLNQPISTLGCIAGWLVATIVFLGVTAKIGGPVEGDAALSVFSTWAIAHGHIACSYTPLGIHSLPTLARPISFIPPLYPLLSAGVLLLFHSTYNVPFPAAANHCATSNVAIYNWALSAHAIIPTIRVGYLSWIALLSGTVAFLRAAGRGRRLWEPATLLFLAISAPVIESLTEYFHPQDIIAMGLILGSLACALRGRWAWAGILIGLAFTSNQFALLVAAPLFVLVPRKSRLMLTGAALGAVALISLPVIVLTSGDAFKATILGSGFTPAKAGGTVLSETDLRGVIQFTLARIFPIVITMAIAWWAKRRLGTGVLQPIPLLSIIATALSLRLVFEFSLYGYFFLGVMTMLVLIDVVEGRFRGAMLTWLAFLTVLFDPFPWGFASNGQQWGLAAREWVPNVFLIGIAVIILVNILRHRHYWYVTAAGLFAGITLVTWPWNHEAIRGQLPTWIIQLVIVPATLWLAIGPLLTAVKDEGQRSAAVEPSAVPAIEST
jgi:hypothetical protein